MTPVLLIDFGSTYTKVTAIDLDRELLLGTAASYTTVETDVTEGLANALALLEAKTGPLTFAHRYACSSAAGGLRMMASGLVPELTAQAAREASLGAGAKVLKTYSFQLTEDDAEEIAALKPDIFLLVGGTDGGNTECILHNAQVLAEVGGEFPIVVAGNRTASRQCQRILEGREVHLCENVMPRFGVLNIEPAQKAIREVFLRRIVKAKGLSTTDSLLSGILMPTPSSVMRAMELLSCGCQEEAGIGDLLAVDVGGATTDVYSVSEGAPTQVNTVCKGLPEPFVKRTVEGDIGMRYSVRGILDAAGPGKLSRISGLPVPRVTQLVQFLREHTDTLPGGNPELEALDRALASCAIETAVTRHAGTIEEAYTLMGLTYVQTGKDLTQTQNLVVTGGSLTHTQQTSKIASYALYDPAQPTSLRPKKAQVLVDRQYILSAMGLLAASHPACALRIMKKEIKVDGDPK